MVKNPPATANVGLIPGAGRSHVPSGKYAHGPQLPSLCSRAWEQQILSPRILLPKPTGSEQVLRKKRSLHMRSPCTATGEQPLLDATKSCAKQRSLSMDKNKDINK